MLEGQFPSNLLAWQQRCAQAGAHDRMVVDKHDAKCHFPSKGSVAARTLPSTVISPPTSSTRARSPFSP